MDALRWLEPVAGALVVASILLDIFLTVLYARMGYSIFADRLARYIWKGVCLVTTPLGSRRPLALSFGGPLIVVFIVAFWVAVLILGQALIFHPALGTAVTASNGATPRGFAGAVFAAGSSTVMPGSSTIQPNTSGFRILFLFNAVTGLSILTLTVTYIVEIYNALHDRNTLALKFFLLTRQTGDAAELIAGLGSGGDFSAGYSMIAEAAAEVIALKESHNFYPVLFYFRFRAPYYSVSMMSTIALDAASLIASALDEHRYGWMAESAAVVALREAAFLLIGTLQETFLPRNSIDRHRPDSRRIETWRRRYSNALLRLGKAGLDVSLDHACGVEKYIALRREWDPYIRTLAPAMGFHLEEIDTAAANASAAAPRA